MHSTAESYAHEPVRYPALQVVNLAAEGAAVTEKYRNMVINRVNDSCLRLAVFDETYRWRRTYCGPTRPRSRARATARARLSTSSFMKMLFTWDLTVSVPIPRSFAISLFDCPLAISSTISRSLALSDACSVS